MSARKRKRDANAESPADKAIDAAFGKGPEEIFDSDLGSESGDQPQAPEVAIEGMEELPDLRDQVDELTDRNLRLQAEMENVRRRAARDITEERRYAAMPLLRDLLDVVDNLQRAIDAADTTTHAENLREGCRLVAQQFQAALAKHHCTPIEAQGVPFDPSFHEAIQQMPSDEQPAGNVMLVTQVGYLLHDRVVRPSQVIVSMGPNKSPLDTQPEDPSG
ncbi:MAG: nucleotide exchange factor GrpE [Pirellulales bacterium]|nr:nucleotide exchange factor GrpE [Pirellulales bacterium]